jgi:hypothetical protein
MGCEDTALSDARPGRVDLGAAGAGLGHKGRDEEGCVALVHVEDIGPNAERIEQMLAAEAKKDLLVQAYPAVAAVQALGQLANGLGILG